MKRFLSRRPSPAIIIAIVALVAALAGTAVAGSGFLTTTKFKKFKQNVAVKGPITYANQTQSVNTFGAPASSNGVTITAACPAGQHAVGGGAKSSTPSAQSGLFVENSYPSASGWTATLFAGVNATTPESITVTAVCVSGNSSGTPPAITP
jgi:hypothetical protein